MKYIDFDGVIVDTHDLLFEDWDKIPNHQDLSEEIKIKYISEVNWRRIIRESEIINDAIYVLNHLNPYETAILTKVHSLYNESTEKIKFLREQGIKQPIIIVPCGFKKNEIVSARGNILVDDSLHNLDDWELDGGTGYFFSKDDKDYDGWNRKNDKPYEKVKSLHFLK